MSNHKMDDFFNPKKRAELGTDEESFALMEQDLPKIKEAIDNLIKESLDSFKPSYDITSSKIAINLLTLKGLGEYDSQDSTVIMQHYKTIDNFDYFVYSCTFKLNISSWSTIESGAGFPDAWDFQLSLDGFNLSSDEDIEAEYFNASVSRNTNSPSNIACSACMLHTKVSAKNISFRVFAAESHSAAHHGSYIGNVTLEIIFVSSRRLI